MSLPRYPEYKDSGVEWLGEVPSHWEVKPLKYLAQNIKAGPFGSSLTKEMYVGSGYRVYGQEQVIPEDFTVGDYYISQEKFLELKQYEVVQNDILISCVGTFGKVAIVPAGIESGIINPRLLRLRCTDLVSPKYLTIVLRSSVVFEQFSLLSRGGTMDIINIGTLSEIWTTVPPIIEQSTIAAFLDFETASLSTLITEQERLIELLKEKRQAVISHAVTKGLDPNVPMKDSGIEWLGEVPEHWRIEKLKYLARFSGGGTPSRDNLDFWNGSIPWTSPKDMKTEKIQETEEFITEAGLQNSASNLLGKGQVLLVVRSGILKHTIPVAINEVPVALNQDMKAISFRNEACFNRFFLRWVQGLNRLLLFVWAKQGATVESIEHAYLSETIIPLPPLEEQIAIVSYLDKETTKIDELIAEANRAIELLKERRSALISAAVTGQIDVRGWTRPEAV